MVYLIPLWLASLAHIPCRCGECFAAQVLCTVKAFGPHQALSWHRESQQLHTPPNLFVWEVP
jgi:hypothetical protein